MEVPRGTGEMSYIEDDGIRCYVCRGRGFIIDQSDKVVCRSCGGDGGWVPPGGDDSMLCPPGVQPRPYGFIPEGDR